MTIFWFTLVFFFSLSTRRFPDKISQMYPSNKSFLFRKFHDGNKRETTLCDDIAENYRLNKMNFMLKDVPLCFVAKCYLRFALFALCWNALSTHTQKTEILVNLQEYVISSSSSRESPFFEMNRRKFYLSPSIALSLFVALLHGKNKFNSRFPEIVQTCFLKNTWRN